MSYPYQEYDSDSTQDNHSFHSDKATCHEEQRLPLNKEVRSDCYQRSAFLTTELFHSKSCNDGDDTSSQEEYHAFDTDEATCDGEPVLPLKEEIRHGNAGAVRQALTEGTLDPNARDDDYTVLHWAAVHTDEKTLREERLEADNMKARRTIVRELLERGAIVNTVWQQEYLADESPMTPMDMTLDKGTMQMLREGSVRQALAVEDSDVNDSLGDRANQLRIGLLSASARGDTRACTKLCSLGADVNDSSLGTTALGTAAAFGHLETVQELVECLGATVDAILRDEDNGQTALYCAVYEGHEDIVKFLLQHGANPLHQTLLCGGMSKWACTGMLDEDSETNVVDIELRKRIIEVVLSASIDRARKQVSSMAKSHGEIDWTVMSWVFCECVRHGYLSGINKLLVTPRFALPPNCLQLAVATGEHDALLYLLRAGALSLYNQQFCEEEHYSGPDFARPTKESVEQCRATLNIWLAESENNQDHGTLRDSR